MLACHHVVLWMLLAAPGAESKLDQQIAEASARYEEGDYIGAAEQLEQLATKTQQPRFLYNAGLARLAASHRAHAIVHLQNYLARTVADGTTPMRNDARARLDQLRAEVRSVQLQVEPGGALRELRVTARYLGRDKRKGPRGDARPLLEVGVDRNTSFQTLFLDPGYWQVVAESRSYLTRELTVHIRSRGRPAKARRIELDADPRYQDVSFHLDVPGDPPPDIEIVARGGADPSAPQTCTRHDLDGKRCNLRLRAGTWSVRTRADGYTTMARTVVVGGSDSSSFTLPLVPMPSPADEPTQKPQVRPEPGAGEEDMSDDDPLPKHLPRPVKRRLANALNIAGLPIFVGGLATSIYGTSRFTDAISTSVNDCGGAAACQAALLAPIRWRTSGVGMIGGGIGLLLTGLTAELDAPNVVWLAQIGVGGALMVGGAGWLTANTFQLNSHLQTLGFSQPDWETALDKKNAQRLAAAGITGLGAGMLVGATVGALVYRRHRGPARTTALRLDPIASPRLQGLVLHGRF